jgi:Site-specific recombinase
VSVLVSLVFSHFYHSPLLSSGQAAYQTSAIHPIHGLAWLYAAIAGVWLFLSGIITGILDNRADYIELKDRLIGHPLFRAISLQRRERIALYIHQNYGALGGNFIFGVLLGMTSYVGYLIDVPLDIRHVAFSSAHAAYAHMSDYSSWLSVLSSLFFVLMIGFINLWVSFGLALFVALRSRNCELDMKSVRTAVLTQIKQHPSSLFWPKDPAPMAKPQGAGQRRAP